MCERGRYCRTYTALGTLNQDTITGLQPSLLTQVVCGVSPMPTMKDVPIEEGVSIRTWTAVLVAGNSTKEGIEEKIKRVGVFMEAWAAVMYLRGEDELLETCMQYDPVEENPVVKKVRTGCVL